MKNVTSCTVCFVHLPNIYFCLYEDYNTSFYVSILPCAYLICLYLMNQILVPSCDHNFCICLTFKKKFFFLQLGFCDLSCAIFLVYF